MMLSVAATLCSVLIYLLALVHAALISSNELNWLEMCAGASKVQYFAVRSSF